MFSLKIFIIFIIIFLISSQNLNFYENSNFITESKSSNFIIKDIKKNKNKFSIVLIYSNYCPHCRNFKDDYEKLAEFYNNQIKFYALNIKTAEEFKKNFDTQYVPVIYFFEYENKTKYNNGNNFETLSNYLNFFLKKCYYINNTNDLFNITNNYILGYFSDNFLLENYINITKNFLHLFQNCYYSNKNISNENKNFIISKNEQNGFNSFYYFNFNYSNIENINKKYFDFIENLFPFQEIKTKSFFFILQYQKKDFLIFCYGNEHYKNEYLNIIEKLNEISNVKNYFNLFLIDFKAVYKKILNIDKNKIYFVDKNLKNIFLFENISEFKNIFYHSFSYENTIKILNTQKNKKKFDFTFFLFILFIYSLIFYLIIINFNLIENEKEFFILKKKENENKENKNDFDESQFLNSIN